MLPVPLLDCSAFDVLSVVENSLAASEVDVGGGQVLQALVIAPLVLVVDYHKP